MFQIQDMGLEDPVPTFSYVVEEVKKRHPSLAYVHLVSHLAPFQAPPKDLSVCLHCGVSADSNETNVIQQLDFVRKIWAPRPLIITGGYERESALQVAEETGQLIGFGRKFIANVSSIQFT